MKKLLTVLILIVLMVFCLLSCRQASTVVESPNQPWAGSLLPDYASRFDYFWRSLNSHYVFWDIDPTDWDAMYDTYMPKFDELDKVFAAAPDDKKDEAAKSAFDKALSYYTEMTKTLVDHHMMVIVFDPYVPSRNSTFYPSDYEVNGRDYFHGRSLRDENNLVTWTEWTDIAYYFDESGIGSATVDGYKSAVNLANADELAVKLLKKYDPVTGEGVAATDNLVDRELCVAYDITIDKKNSAGSDMHVVYLATANYYIRNVWIPAYLNSPSACPADPESAFRWKAGKTLIAYFSAIKKYYDSGELAGVIVDNRVNSGGNSDDLNAMIGLYTDKPVTIQYVKVKEGFGKTDYCSEVPLIVSPSKSTEFITGYPELSCDLVSANIPYVILCSLKSISMGEITTSGIAALKNGYSIGERTYGATGALFSDSKLLTLTYGGTFGDSSAGPMYCYTSTCNARCYTRNEFKSIEGIGFTPDKEIYFKSTGEGNLVKDVQTMYKAQVKEAFSYIAMH